MSNALPDFTDLNWMSTLRSSSLHGEAMLKFHIEQCRARIAELEAGMVAYGTVLQLVDRGTDKAFVVSLANGQMVEFAVPEWARGKVTVGHGVRIRMQQGQPPAVLSIIDKPPGAGMTVTVSRVIDAHTCEFQMMGGSRTAVFAGKVCVGDKVVIDTRNEAVVMNLGADTGMREFDGVTGVTWDDIGGLAEAKRLLQEAIEEPVTKAEIYRRHGQKVPKGILLFGPPGTGKTMLAKACVTSLARLYGKRARASGFQYVKGPDLLNGLVGQSEANVRQLFAAARAHFTEAGYPAIVFIDEADAILAARGKNIRWQGMEQTVVPMFLNEMDGLTASNCIVMLATNRPATLDPAVVRDGRIDRKIEIPRPNADESRAIFERHLAGRCEPDRVPVLLDAGVTELFDERHAFYRVKAKDGHDKLFTLAQLVSGAMIAGICARASQLAIRREIEGTGGPLSAEDVRAAVNEVDAENRAVNHDDDLQAFVQQQRISVLAVEPLGGRAAVA